MESNTQTNQVQFIMREACKNCPERINLICEDCVYGGYYMWSNSEEIVGQLALRCLYLSNKWPYQNYKVGVIVESGRDQDEVRRAIAFNLHDRYGWDLGNILYDKLAFIKKSEDIIGLRLLPILYCSQRFWGAGSWKSFLKISREMKLVQDIHIRMGALYGVVPQYLFGQWEWGDMPFFLNED